MESVEKPFGITEAHASSVVHIVLISVLVGFLLSTFWSARFVDQEIGNSLSDTILGFDASDAVIGSLITGILYALVTGFAGTFTACNICVFSAIAPLAAEKRSSGKLLQPLLHLLIGMVIVAGLYGAVGVFVGSAMPQLSSTRLGDAETGMRLRSLQSMIVFVSIGTIYVLWGLMNLNIIRNPFLPIAIRYPWARSVFMGATIGAFLIGRPFGLFRHMFEYAVSTHNPLLGSLTFVLQSVGNVLIMVVILLLLVYGTGGRFERWLHANPDRVKTMTAAFLIIGGTFFILYWGPRLLARNDLFFWPYFDWNSKTLLFN